MTKQERNDVILQALQAELQDKPYAKEKLLEQFELWVQGLVAQGNQLLAGQPSEMQPDAAQGAEAAGGPAPEEPSPESGEVPAPETNEGGE